MQRTQVAAGTVFERHEKKYMLSHAQYEALRAALGPTMCPDRYGLHTICSIYYDTPDYAIVRHALDKPVYKEKFRVRSYGVPGPDDTVFLELKKKLDGVTHKRRAPLTLREADDYLCRGIMPEGAGQVLSEIDWFLSQRPLRPTVCLCCDRIALAARDDPELRITFDANIRWRAEDLNLAHGDHGATLIGSDAHLMEIKAAGAFPPDLARILSELEIYPTSFSKYGKVYQNCLMSEVALKYAG